MAVRAARGRGASLQGDFVHCVRGEGEYGCVLRTDTGQCDDGLRVFGEESPHATQGVGAEKHELQDSAVLEPRDQHAVAVGCIIGQGRHGLRAGVNERAADCSLPHGRCHLPLRQ